MLRSKLLTLGLLQCLLVAMVGGQTSSSPTFTATASATPTPSPVQLPPLNAFLGYSLSPSNTAATITLYATVSTALGQYNPLSSIRNSLLQNFIGAPLGALVFAALLFYTVHPSTAPGSGLACCCRPHSGGAKAPLDDTTPWTVGDGSGGAGGGVVASKWIAWGATSLFLLGWTLLVTSFVLPWAPFSPTLTLPFLAAATTCDPATTSLLSAGSPGDILCQGGNQLSIGLGFLAAATAFAGCAWGVAWVVTIRLRNVAHHATLPPHLYFFGTLPPAVVMGWIASACGLVGVVLTWVGYYGISSLFPPSLPSRPPPGGIAALLGLIAIVLACLALGEVFNVLPAPIPNLTGSGAYSIWPLRALKRDANFSSTTASDSSVEEGGSGRTSPSRSSPVSALAPLPGTWQQQQQVQQQQAQAQGPPYYPYPSGGSSFGGGGGIPPPLAYPPILPTGALGSRPGERLDARLMNMYFPQTVLSSQPTRTQPLQQPPPPLQPPPPPPPAHYSSVPQPGGFPSATGSVEEAFNVVRAAEMIRKSQQLEAAASEAALAAARLSLESAIAREEAEEKDRRRWEQFEGAAAAAAVEAARKMRRSSQSASAQRAAETLRLIRSLPISAFRMLVCEGFGRTTLYICCFFTHFLSFLALENLFLLPSPPLTTYPFPFLFPYYFPHPTPFSSS